MANLVAALNANLVADLAANLAADLVLVLPPVAEAVIIAKVSKDLGLDLSQDLRTIAHSAQIPKFNAISVKNVVIQLETVILLKNCESFTNYRRIRALKPLRSLQDWLATPIWI